MSFQASVGRYDKMIYRHCGKSGLKLPAISLGLWHNFGNITPFETQRDILRRAFDLGITHFDLANNYGPPFGEAERNFGIHMDRDWHTYRDELIISTKAGYDMWDGPYGNNGTRKHLIASLDQSLKRMHLDYVDIFYHHRPDPQTPIEETMGALDQIVRSGKALYVGISNYNAEESRIAISTLRKMGTPILIHQKNYSMLNRSLENGLGQLLCDEGIGCTAFAPLGGGILTNRYLDGMPPDSRAVNDPRYLKTTDITEKKLNVVRRLDTIAKKRGQSMAQLAIQWTLCNPSVTSALIGASRPQQISENVSALSFPDLTQGELREIDNILKDLN